jgi:hypothetical protein
MRSFFLTRLLREKLLLLGLVAIAAAMWLSAVSNRVRTFWTEVSVTSAELDDQKRWLTEGPRIQAAAKQAIEHLDPTRTFDSVRLPAELYAVARSVGITKDVAIDESQTTPGPQFSIHSVRFVIRNASWENHVEPFYQELSKRAPYIGIEEFAISANRANPAQLTASLRVSAVEITR